LIASLTACAAALALAGTVAVQSFPLEAQGRAPAGTAEPIQVLRGGEHLLHGQMPEYPHRAIEQKIQGDVIVDLTLDARGEVLDARVLSGPDELRKATLESVLQWHYSPSALSSTVTQATLRFQIPPGGFEKVEIAEGVSFQGDVEIHVPAAGVELRAQEVKILAAQPSELLLDATPEAKHSELQEKDVELHAIARMLEPNEAWHDRKPWTLAMKVVELDENHLSETLKGGPKLAEVRTERVTDATAKEVLVQADVAVGDVITEAAARRIQKAAAALDEHIVVEFQKEKKGLVITILTR
jgi:TonB family protein